MSKIPLSSQVCGGGSRAFRAGLCALSLALLASTRVHAVDGFAATNGGTTGGAGGPTVTVTNATDLQTYVGSHDPYIVQVSGTIDLGGSQATVRENKTIVGLGSNATILGGLKISGYNNLIVQNLTLKGASNDGLTIQNAQHVWVDHCTVIDAADGSIDITHACEWVTVSWCKFLYTVDHGHDFVNLIGHDDANGAEDRGHLHVTFHHNWWSTLCIERMPRVRFGQVHVYNNYYGCTGNNYCIRAALESQILAESNYFDNVNTAWEYYTLSGQTPGKIRAVGNVFVNTAVPAGGNDSVFAPPYSYTLDTASNVKSIVLAGAGANGTNGGGGGGNLSPSVSITSPANGASFIAPANLTIAANATDSDGTVSSVAFYANGSLIGTDTSAPYSIAWSNVAAGSYSLTAVATDNAGAKTTSAAVSVTVTTSGGTGGTTITFNPVATEDGYVLESSETSNLGGSTNSSDTTSAALRAGDDSTDRQYKAILSFDTSAIPDGATIVSATLKLRRGTVVGTNPFTTHGSLLVDVKGGAGFNGSTTLQTTDFQAPADATQVATMSAANANGDWSTGALNATGRGLVNKTGKTQFRVYFSLDDNDDLSADYVGFNGGNDATVANRPILEITYQ